MICLLPIFASALLAGCAISPKSEYCDVAGQIRTSRSDVLTDETARQIDQEQEKFAAFCGAKK